jgi:hypothetical protein
MLFIALSVVLAAFFGAWAFGEYRTQHAWTYLATGVASLAAGVVLAVYGTLFQRKTRHL